MVATCPYVSCSMFDGHGATNLLSRKATLRPAEAGLSRPRSWDAPCSVEVRLASNIMSRSLE